ncbi:hypothetical protein SAMN03159341_116102 [Paenibacillus sp. 1_12]|nr:hypothetical protein SAMN03159341_116102 [Paenibacillus sp. 1_12]
MEILVLGHFEVPDIVRLMIDVISRLPLKDLFAMDDEKGIGSAFVWSSKLSGDKNIISLIAAKIAAFLFYGIKFLSKANDNNFIPFPTDFQFSKYSFKSSRNVLVM